MTRVLIIEPGYCPYQAAFDSPQAAISEVIEGDSLLLKPFGTSKIGVVCSKNQSRLKYNRQLEDAPGLYGAGRHRIACLCGGADLPRNYRRSIR